MTASPDPTNPASEGEEMRRAIIAALNDAFRGFSFPGGRWSTGFGAEMAADALLRGPLAQLRSDLTAAREERDDYRDDLVRMHQDKMDRLERALAAESEASQLRETVAKLKEGQDFLQEVYEATIARWRDAALLGVGGDLRKVQRLLDASSQRIVGSALSSSETGDRT